MKTKNGHIFTFSEKMQISAILCFATCDWFCPMKSQIQIASNIEQSSDSLLIHLVNAVNKLMTQHAMDMTKLKTGMGKIEKEIQRQNILQMEELQRVTEENGKLQNSKN